MYISYFDNNHDSLPIIKVVKAGKLKDTEKQGMCFLREYS